MKIIVLLLCLLSIRVSGESSVNLLKNSGFESGKESWNLLEWSSPKGEAKFTLDKVSHSGEYCAKIEHISGGNNILLEQKIKLDGEKTLVLSFFAKVNLDVGVDGTIQCSIMSFDKEGNKLQYLIQTFSANSDWKQFIYKFVTHKNTASLQVYLRNHEITTYYDDVSLKEDLNLLSIEDITLWYPQQQIIADVYLKPNHKNSTTLKCEIFSEKNNQEAIDTKEIVTKEHKNIEIVFNIKDIITGNYFFKSTLLDENNKKIGESVSRKFIWPKKRTWKTQDVGEVRNLNNFVSILFSRKDIEVNGLKNISFVNPREGWIYIQATDSSAPITITLNDSNKTIIALDKQNSSNNTMRFLNKGNHLITINTSSNAVIKDLSIRTMPEIILCEYDAYKLENTYDAGAQWVDEYFERTWAGTQRLLDVCNVILENFDEPRSGNGFRVGNNKAKLNRITKWRGLGRKVIVNSDIPGTLNSLPASEAYNVWTDSIGMKEFDGIALDEYAHEKEKDVVFYENATERINTNKEFEGKRLYAYSNAAWDTHTKTAKLRKILKEGNHLFAPELYLREQRTEIKAKKNIVNSFGWLSHWAQTDPEYISNMIVVLCTANAGERTFYRQDTHANVDFKVYYDLQMNYMANDPAFFDVGGISSWVIRYTNKETLLWVAELYKHYCIEGKRNLLSEEYGYTYNLPYIKNPDFYEELNNWTVAEARNNSIKIKNLPGWGYARGFCNEQPDGDTFVVMDIDSKKTNVISQTINNLIPGKLYSAEMFSADFEDIIAGKNIEKFNSVSLQISGAEVIDKLSYVKKAKSQHTMSPQFPSSGPNLNFHYVIFKAQAETATVTIMDRPEKSVANKFAASQKQVLFNFVQVQPYLTLSAIEEQKK